MNVPWPVYPAIVAWCIGFILQTVMLREIDHGKVALFKATPTGGHYLKGHVATEILTERGLTAAKCRNERKDRPSSFHISMFRWRNLQRNAAL